MTLIAGPQSGYLSIRVIIDMSSLLHRQLPRAAGEVLRGLHPGSQQLGTGLAKYLIIFTPFKYNMIALSRCTPSPVTLATYSPSTPKSLQRRQQSLRQPQPQQPQLQQLPPPVWQCQGRIPAADVSSPSPPRGWPTRSVPIIITPSGAVPRYYSFQASKCQHIPLGDSYYYWLIYSVKGGKWSRWQWGITISKKSLPRAANAPLTAPLNIIYYFSSQTFPAIHMTSSQSLACMHHVCVDSYTRNSVPSTLSSSKKI